MPNSVTKIGNYAFASSARLTDVFIPGTVKSIGKNILDDCDVVNLGIPGLNHIGYYLNDTLVEDYSYEVKLYSYGNGETKTTSYYIPNTLKELTITGGNASKGIFIGCSTLTKISFSENVTFIVGGTDSTNCSCDAVEELTFEEGIKVISGLSHAEWSCPIVIPDSVTEISYNAFQANVNIPSVKLSKNLVTIGEYAFAACRSISTITFPKSLRRMDENAFGGCISLTSIYYEGTMQEWASIQIASNWHTNVPATGVICSDGTVDF